MKRYFIRCMGTILSAFTAFLTTDRAESAPHFDYEKTFTLGNDKYTITVYTGAAWYVGWVNLNPKTKSSKFYSLMYVPEYPGVLHLHTIWSKDKIELDLSHKNPEQLKMFKNKEFEIFNPHYLSYYFYLPKLIRDVIE